MRFTGQVAIVTGATGGIGMAVATRLAHEGASVVLAARNSLKLAQAQAQLQAAGAPAVFCSTCDVSHEDQVRNTVDETIARFGRLDVVVNNAGVMNFKPLEEQTAEDWNSVLGVDLLGAFFFIKHAFRVMIHGGAIVNVSSVHAVETSPLIAPYAAAKTALLSLTRSAALEGKPRHIRVNAVLPGAIDTPMLWDNPNIKSGVEKIDQRDVGQPENVAAAITYLASPDAAFVQGAMLRVDGGRLDRL
ncbi:SDR family oxidoreductase [Massilia solisilvae]|uniref:SDR family oxidoreductase n=1 Tax=Massilia solisilvae TaxID=1811225 RepID=A0ABT2BR22_9BURK|nr:SDR family NAD(P)-dependent oxidoreductase [Massilia solisilvae]MCS0610957.1 SDR family oxidoreductase [Massilia solisilvae]